MKRTGRVAVLLIACLLSVAAAFAATVSGTVKNATSGKFAIGDDVILLRLEGSMEEVARTKVDRNGHFTLQAPGDGPFLLRVTHDQVNYHKPVPPGTETVDVEVYDANAKPGDINATVYDIALRASPDTLDVQEVYVVNNSSSPPRTYNPDHSFNIALPSQAKIEDSLVSGPGGMPIKSAPIPEQGKPGRYAFAYPLRPGETTFSVLYHLPYSGKQAFDPQPQYRFEHFAVEVPKSMQFHASSTAFKAMPEKDGISAALASQVKPGDDLKFEVAGTGEFPRDDAANGASAAASAPAQPGGGIGEPEGTPDPLKQWRWYILGGLAVVLAVGGVFVVRRPVAGAQPIYPAAPPAAGASPLIATLKEEMFQLELELHQGKLSREEYDRLRAAFDLLLARAVKRSPAAA